MYVFCKYGTSKREGKERNEEGGRRSEGLKKAVRKSAGVKRVPVDSW